MNVENDVLVQIRGELRVLHRRIQRLELAADTQAEAGEVVNTQPILARFRLLIAQAGIVQGRNDSLACCISQALGITPRELQEQLRARAGMAFL